MKKITLPDYWKKQQLLYTDRSSDGEIIACGNCYLEANRIADAAECYQRANYRAGLEKVRDMAEAAGDVMLYQQALKALNQIATPDDWDRIGKQAFALKKYTFSLHAFEKSENGVMIGEIRKILSGLKEKVA